MPSPGAYSVEVPNPNLDEPIPDTIPGRNIISDIKLAWDIFNPFNVQYTDAHFICATVEVDPSAAQQWLPPLMKLAKPYRADIFLAYYPNVCFRTTYKEAGLCFYVKGFGKSEIKHCVWMTLDDDRATVLGRELQGWPKKYADVEFNLEAAEEGALFEGKCSRRGVDVITMSGRIGEKLDPSTSAPVLGGNYRNAYGLMGAPLPWIVSFNYVENPTVAHRVDDFEYSLGKSLNDPLQAMGLGKPYNVRFHRSNVVYTRPPIPYRPLPPFWTLTRLRPRVL